MANSDSTRRTDLPTTHLPSDGNASVADGKGKTSYRCGYAAGFRRGYSEAVSDRRYTDNVRQKRGLPQ